MLGFLSTSSTIPVTIVLMLACMSELPRPAHASCELPSELVGTWYRIKDDVTITITSSGTEGQEFGTVYTGAYDCYESSGNQYVFVTQTTVNNPFGGFDKGYFCWELIQLTDITIAVYHLTDIEVQGAFYTLPAHGVTEGSGDPSLAEVCSLSKETVVPTLLFKIPSGTVAISDISTAQQRCSADLFHTYSYVKDGTDCAGTESKLDFCQDRATAHINYTACATQILFSADGVLSCLAYAKVGDLLYQLLVNHDATVDDSATFRFVCMRVTESGEATVYPKDCDGASHQLTLTVTESCPLTEDDNTVIIVVGVVVPLLIIIIIIVTVVLVYNFVYVKRKAAAIAPSENKPLPNGNSAHSEETAATSDGEETRPSPVGMEGALNSNEGKTTPVGTEGPVKSNEGKTTPVGTEGPVESNEGKTTPVGAEGPVESNDGENTHIGTAGNDPPGRLPPLDFDTPRSEALRH